MISVWLVRGSVWNESSESWCRSCYRRDRGWCLDICRHCPSYHINFHEDIRIQHNFTELNKRSLSVSPSHTDTPISRCTLWHVENFSNIQNEGVKLCRTQDRRFLKGACRHGRYKDSSDGIKFKDLQNLLYT